MKTIDNVSKVLIHWSENPYLNRMYSAVNGDINKEVTLNDFTLKCKAASFDAPDIGGGYDKTKYTVYFDDGESVTLRLDLTKRVYNPKDNIVEYLKSNGGY